MTQLKRFQEALLKSDFDCAIISSEINQRYLCDFDFSDGYIIVSADIAYIFTDSRYIEAIRNCVKGFDIILREKSMGETITEFIRNKKFSNIAFEEASLPYDLYETWKELLKDNFSLRPGASAILSAQRSIKLPYEIERIEKAQQITDSAFEHILSFIHPNVTEKEISLELEFFMRRNGAEGVAFDTIAVSGTHSSLPHGTPREQKLCQGFLTMDFGAKYMGYCADMTRTVVLGKANEEMKKVYSTVLRAQQNALDNICDGMLCKDADDLARSVIKDAGYASAFGHSLGHGVGMYIHESPSLSPTANINSKLSAGNVVTVEPGIYLEGKFGCRIEDMVLINADGSVRNFTKSSKELIEI